MKKEKILIVEDEILTSDTIKKYLKRMGFSAISQAFDFYQALKEFRTFSPDIVLLDIRLGKGPSGIDFAYHLRELKSKSLIIFLTAQMDKSNIEKAKHLHPDGYLPKPIREKSLLASIEFALMKGNSREDSISTAEMQNIISIENEKLLLSDILFLETKHVYTFIYLRGEKTPRIYRLSLKSVLSLFPDGKIIQTHRSFAVHLRYVESYNRNFLELSGSKVPISRSRYKNFSEAYSEYENQ